MAGALRAGRGPRTRPHRAAVLAHVTSAPASCCTGHSRFSHVVASLAGRIRRDAGVSCHEHGIDGWEVSVHRSLNADAEPPLRAADDRDREPVAAPAVAAAARDYVIDLPQKSDAAAIARCFLEVYGHHYVHAEVFSTRRYWDKVERGELIPAVARDSEGEVIGHIALEREPGMQVAERGEAVVRTAHRGHGLLERMTARLREEAPKHDLHGIYAEPLTIHTFSQRNDARAGMPVCAVLLGANPEDFRPKGVPSPTAGQRQSYLRTFRFVQPPAPRTIYAPAPYREMLLKLYASLGVTVAAAAPRRGGSGLTHQHQGQRSRLRPDLVRADRPQRRHRSSPRRCATCGRSAPFPFSSPRRSPTPAFPCSPMPPARSAFSSAAWDRPLPMAPTPFCCSG